MARVYWEPLSEESAASLGVFAHQPLTVPAGSTIKGFDSSAAPAERERHPPAPASWC